MRTIQAQNLATFTVRSCEGNLLKNVAKFCINCYNRQNVRIMDKCDGRCRFLASF